MGVTVYQRGQLTTNVPRRGHGCVRGGVRGARADEQGEKDGEDGEDGEGK